MEIVIKTSVICIISVILALIVSKDTPQFAISIIFITSIVVFGLCLDYVNEIFVGVSEIIEISGISIGIFEPVIKVCAISITAKITSDVCNDSGFGSMAQKIQFVASVASIVAIFPLFNMIIGILKDIV